MYYIYMCKFTYILSYTLCTIAASTHGAPVTARPIKPVGTIRAIWTYEALRTPVCIDMNH